MGFDYNSVLLAAGAAGIAFCSTLVMSWLRDRSSMFLLTWAVAILLIITAICGFLVFQTSVETIHAVASGVVLIAAYSIDYGGLKQFQTGRLPVGKVAGLTLVGAAPIVVAGALGFDGLAFVLINAMGAVLLGVTAQRFWAIRAESPIPLGAIAFLHAMLSVSYVSCAVVMLAETPLYLNGQPPSNWAELLNLVISVIAITGIGGLFITIHQERISRRHQMASLTDPLTGLHNRRALFERFAVGDVPAGTGLIIFDLDDFKGLNDRHGHGCGDAILQAFAKMLVHHTRSGDMAVRLGGEEFALVLSESAPAHTVAVAERIRGATGRLQHQSGGEVVTVTVSAGVAVSEEACGLDTLMRRADNALYLSKRSGRNRVSQTSSAA